MYLWGRLCYHVKNIRRTLRFFKQRHTRGWDDRETWNLDAAFAEWILPRLKRFKVLNNGYPMDLTEESWNELLDVMIEGFTIMASEDKWALSDEQRTKVETAIQVFSVRVHDLWW